MKLKQYPKYKETNVSFIGNIPTEWNICRLKFLVKQKKFAIVDGPFGSQMKVEDFTDVGIPVIEMDDLKGEKFKEDFDRFISEEKFRGLMRSKVISGDLVFSKTGTMGLIKEISKNFKKGIITSRLAKISLQNSKIINDYAIYAFINLKNQGYWDAVCYGSTMDILTTEMICNSILSIPSIKEQEDITTFLDKKTTEINSLLEKDKHLIELLKEKRIALINQVVTKGLNPKTKFKDSGIDWIGKIPEGWEVDKLKFILNERKTKKTNSLNEDYLGLENIEPFSCRIINYNESDYIDGESLKFFKEDVLFGKLRPYLAKVALAVKSGCCSSEIIVYVPTDKIIPQFAMYKLVSKQYLDYINSLTYGVKMPRADPSTLANIKHGFPPKKEQTAIVQYLDKATNKIDETIKKIKKRMKLLEEYKKSLIHNVVTGKVDVTNM